jgi:membrane protein YdbS with pleckstrin-like domain
LAPGPETSAAGAEPADDARRRGRIPLTARVGVTGHRAVAGDDTVLGEEVRQALDLVQSRCRTGTAATPVSLTVVSALAEGADRIVAWEAIKRGAHLEVVLPLAPDDYLADFGSDASKSEFRALLGQATAITELGGTGARDKAYEQAGRAIVNRSDVLMALWDGRPGHGRGGTAETVSYARRQHVPVLQVAVERVGQGALQPRAVREPELPEFFGLLSDEAFGRLDRFNSASLPPGAKSAILLPAGLKTPVPPHVRDFVAYAQPYFDRAEQTAGHSQRLYKVLTRLLYSLAAAAVIVVATQVTFFSGHPAIVWAEVAALVTIVVTLALGRFARWHDRWLAARYLAERIRSGLFLAAVGGGNDLRTAPGGAPPGGGEPPEANQEWVERAFREIYWRAPRPRADDAEFPVLRHLLTEAWIDDQVGYHTGVSKRLTRRQRQLGWLAIALFALSALAAVCHSVDLLGSNVWGYLSVVIPAVAAAIAGYSAQREYARIADRSRLMVNRLSEARRQIEGTRRMSSLQRAADSTEVLMRAETADWYEVVRLHDFEVPA